MKEDLVAEISTASEETSRQVVLKSHAMADVFGLSPSDFDYFSLLIRNGPATAGQLAVMTRLTTGAVTGVIDRLEEADLARRQHDQLDRRRIIVVPTSHAVKKYQAFHQKSDKAFAACLATFSPHEQAAILNFLRATTEFLREETAHIKR